MTTRVLYLAGREASYSRTRSVRKALERAHFEVEAYAPKTRSKLQQVSVVWAFLRRRRDADVILVGFYGQLMLPLVRLFTNKPILFDVYAVTYGTLVEDRKLTRSGSILAKLFWLTDHVAMRCADRMIIDSDHQVRRLASTYRIDATRVKRLYLSSDEAVMHPRPGVAPPARFRVHFHGEFAPFHGVDVILRAAKLLETHDVDFQIIGTGITYARDRKLAAELQLTNVEFIDRVPYAELAQYMSRAHACLGIFGDSVRADRELTNKVVEAMAVGRPLITRDNPTVRELLADGESALLIEPGRPDKLVDAILRLKADPELQRRLGQNALEQYRRHCAEAVFAGELERTILDLAASGRQLESVA